MSVGGNEQPTRKIKRRIQVGGLFHRSSKMSVTIGKAGVLGPWVWLFLFSSSPMAKLRYIMPLRAVLSNRVTRGLKTSYGSGYPRRRRLWGSGNVLAAVTAI